MAENEKLKAIIEHNLKHQLYCEGKQGGTVLKLLERIEKLREALGMISIYFDKDGLKAREALAKDRDLFC